MNKVLQNKLIKISRDNLHLPNSRTKHFTFIVTGQKVICMGYNNSWKTSPLAKRFGHRFHTIHSELSAIKKFPYPIEQLHKYDVVNVRLTKTGMLALSKPCIFCCDMLDFFNVKNIWYSYQEGFIEL